MPKYNADEQTQLAEPIEVTIGGKNYVVKKVSMAIMDELDVIAKKGGATAAHEQLALLTGVDVQEFAEVDLRKVGAALAWITDTIFEGVKKPKNS